MIPKTESQSAKGNSCPY